MKKSFTAKQAKAIDLIATGEITDHNIAQELSVQPATISRWRRLDGFMEEVIRRARKKLKHDMPEVYKALSKRSKAGESRHIKIYLEHIEKLEQIKASQANITFTWLPEREVEHD